MASSRREHLLATASELFYRHGCHTTGIDKILAEAGVAKMTLYKHFRSKDELILTAVSQSLAQRRAELETAIDSADVPPQKRLLRIYDVMADSMRQNQYRGCLAINVAVEYPDVEHPIHQVCARYKLTRRQHLARLADEAELPDPETLAEELQLLLEGATVMTQLTGNLKHMDRARQAAERLIDLALDEAATAEEQQHYGG